MSEFINYNGKLLDVSTPIIPAANRGLRYGDGLFETMKMLDGEIRLFDAHMERLFKGLALLHFELPVHFTKEVLLDAILKICSRNKVEKAARIRLNLFRGNGGLYDIENLKPNYVIEASPLPDHYLKLNENGLLLDTFTDMRKCCDLLCNCKTNNYQIYSMAAFYAREQKVNDCFVLNEYGRICDTTLANVFWIKKDKVFTIALSEGGVAGVMRQYLKVQLIKNGYEVEEAQLTFPELENASEVFLTNAAYGIRWVKQHKNSHYTNTTIQKIYRDIR